MCATLPVYPDWVEDVISTLEDNLFNHNLRQIGVRSEVESLKATLFSLWRTPGMDLVKFEDGAQQWMSGYITRNVKAPVGSEDRSDWETYAPEALHEAISQWSSSITSRLGQVGGDSEVQFCNYNDPTHYLGGCHSQRPGTSRPAAFE